MKYTVRLLLLFRFLLFNDSASTSIYTLSLHDALPICIGLPSATCPRCSDAPYMPQESAAPNARAIHDMKLSPFGPKTGPFQGSDRKSTRLNSSHSQISYAVFCLKKKKAIVN